MHVKPNYPRSLFFSVSEKQGIHLIPYLVIQSYTHSTNIHGCLFWELGTYFLLEGKRPRNESSWTVERAGSLEEGCSME